MIAVVVINARVIVDSCERSAVQPYIGFGTAIGVLLEQQLAAGAIVKAGTQTILINLLDAQRPAGFLSH